VTSASRSRVPAAAPAGTPGALGPYTSRLHRRWLSEEAAAGPGAAGPRHRAIDGSLLFADVSGFTPLAERLARHGKVGAEELTDTLNAVFTDLLGVAARYGGDCLKFGGDALLLLFDEPGHARRAAAAGVGMQDALRALRRQRSSVGVARLGISMGVHTGPVDCVLVGATHRELVATGPAVSAVLALEGAAGAGEVLVGDATAAALDLDDVEEIESGLRLRRAPAAALHRSGAVASDSATSAIPEALRPHLDGTRRDGEHRPAAVCFLQLKGTDELLAAHGADALAEALHGAISATQEVCAEHGVTFVATDADKGGVKVILAAGVPSASTDDEDRVLLAARAAVDRVPPSLQARAGLHRGRIFAVDLGSPERRTFTVMGDAVNLAARVMGRGEPGQVVATDDVLARRRSDLELEPLPPFPVKGKSQPVHAALVGHAVGRQVAGRSTGQTAAAAGAPPVAVPLVGRAAELQALVEACDRALEGAGRIVELVGEPGIGKSRLLGATVAHGHALVHFRFEAGRYSLATPYFALRRGLREAMGLGLESPAAEVEAALRQVVADTAPELEPWLSLLGVPLGIDLPDSPQSAKLDADRRRATLHEAVVALMGKVLSGPTLITVEDSHWLDVASSELLLALLSQVEERPWAVVVTRRPVEGGLDLSEAPGVTSIALQPLDRPALLELAAELDPGNELQPVAHAQLVDRCSGNPLFLGELVSAARSATAAGGHLAQLPDTNEAVI
jgi:class 3 adenylate cyclase